MLGVLGLGSFSVEGFRVEGFRFRFRLPRPEKATDPNVRGDAAARTPSRSAFPQHLRVLHEVVDGLPWFKV